jgi:LacI family transcriptional regulator, galactose operon repressor
VAGRASIDDVARAAGVSAKVAVMALNDRGYLTTKTRELVRAAAAQIGYRPRFSAAPMTAMGRPGVAFVSTDLRRTAALECGVSACCRNYSTPIVIEQVAEGEPGCAALAMLAREGGLRAVILAPAAFADAALADALAESGLAHVLLQPQAGPRAFKVEWDRGYQGARLVLAAPARGVAAELRETA